MKIAIVAPSPTPFLIGGAEKLFMGLLWYSNKYTSHAVELLKLPCQDQEFWSLMDCYRRFSELNVDDFDMVITTKYPAWMLHHKNHHVYLQHTCRGVYDLYYKRANLFEPLPENKELNKIYSMISNKESDFNCLPIFFKELFKLQSDTLLSQFFSFPGPLTRAIIHFLDRIALSAKNIKNYNAISYNVSLRENYFPENVNIQVIHHPTNLENLHSKEYKYIFTASRLEDLKRIDLLIDAYKKVNSSMSFKIAGIGSALNRLKHLANNDKRIEFLGFVSDEQLIAHYSNAYFVPYIPYDEDYGLITLEAMQSQKCVITTTDAGGTNELVLNEFNGLIVPPSTKDIAAAMQKLIDNPQYTINLSKNAKDSVQEINWHNTIIKLLRETSTFKTLSISKRKKIIILSTFSVFPAMQGGQKRIYYLCRELAKKFDITIISLTSNSSLAGTRFLYPNLKEISVLKSKEHIDYEMKIASLLKFNAIEDIAAIDGYEKTPKFVEILKNEAAIADIAIVSCPYLYFALKRFFNGDIFYDAQNAEYSLKGMILPQSDYKQQYLNNIYQTEKTCAADAKAVFYISKIDMDFFVDKYGIKQSKCVYVPNGEDFKYANTKTLDTAHRNKLKNQLLLNAKNVVFSGSEHKPNQEAIHLIEQFAKILPSINFFIVGSVCNAIKEEEDNIIPLGIISENEKALTYNISDLSLNPVLQGSGSNLKLIDYVAFKVPCLTTSIGQRGYDIDGIFCAEIKNFPEKIEELLSFSQETLEKSANAAYNSASKKYDWSIIAQPLLRLLAL